MKHGDGPDRSFGFVTIDRLITSRDGQLMIHELTSPRTGLSARVAVKHSFKEGPFELYALLAKATGVCNLDDLVAALREWGPSEGRQP